MAPKPALPVKLYYRIGEVADTVGVEPHVLRYWETEFGTIRPQKSPKGQRVYSRKDVEKLLRVKELLYGQGYTIAGAKKRLREMTTRKDAEPEVPTTDGVERRFVSPDAEGPGRTSAIPRDERTTSGSALEWGAVASRASELPAGATSSSAFSLSPEPVPSLTKPPVPRRFSFAFLDEEEAPALTATAREKSGAREGAGTTSTPELSPIPELSSIPELEVPGESSVSSGEDFGRRGLGEGARIRLTALRDRLEEELRDVVRRRSFWATDDETRTIPKPGAAGGASNAASARGRTMSEPASGRSR